MIALANDHTGYELKQEIITLLEEKGLAYKDFGTAKDEKGDYPAYGYKAAKAVAEGVCERGIIICGTGVGISISANKVPGIRCVVCSEPYSAILSKQHNNSNMLAIGARVVGSELAKMIVDGWLTAEFESGGRHQCRVELIHEIEAGTYRG
ncbi:MAG: ribose 5-phosphate isomerase B [Oscillospiraceae bacterium]|nr:ribose 5-phosphate isomerase B [Oscillospiraceae bacterium]